MWTKKFWQGTAERAVATFSGTVVLLGGSDMTGYLELDWTKIAALSAIHAGLSVLKALASRAKNGTASVGAFEAPNIRVYQSKP